MLYVIDIHPIRCCFIQGVFGQIIETAADQGLNFLNAAQGFSPVVIAPFHSLRSVVAQRGANVFQMAQACPESSRRVVLFAADDQHLCAAHPERKPALSVSKDRRIAQEPIAAGDHTCTPQVARSRDLCEGARGLRPPWHLRIRQGKCAVT